MINKPLLENEDIFKLYATGVRDFTGYRLYISDPIETNLSGVDFRSVGWVEARNPKHDKYKTN